MKPIFAAALLSSTFLSPVWADELKMSSKLSEVTVYPQGAQVTRIVTGDIKAGEHVIVIEDLPGKVVANSVRVAGRSGEQLEIGSVDVRQIYTAGKDRSDERQKIEDQIESLEDEIDGLGVEINNADTQRAILQQLASKAIAPSPQGETRSLVISAQELKSLMTVTGEQFAALSNISENARISQRRLAKNVEDLRRQLEQLAPQQKMTTQVAINVASAESAPAEFRVSYQINEAGWAPHYDARLTLGDAGTDSEIEIVRRASVRQSTTEKWNNISLTLSTARPKANTQVPKLSPYILSEYQQYLSKSRNRQRNQGAMEQMLAEAPQADASRRLERALVAKRPALFKKVAEEVAGFLVEYKIAGAVDIANAGVEKNVVIGSSVFPAKIAAHSVPSIDPSAYLTAELKLESKSPWLPGQVTLSRDQVFLGKSNLPLLNPGQEFTMGFGQDDFVKVERSLITDEKGESGFISSVNVEEREYITTIANLHDFPINVVIQDQLPYATHEDIVVEIKKGSDKPTQTDVDKQRGVLAWENVLEPKSEKTIEFGFTVTWPKEMKITPVR